MFESRRWIKIKFIFEKLAKCFDLLSSKEFVPLNHKNVDTTFSFVILSLLTLQMLLFWQSSKENIWRNGWRRNVSYPEHTTTRSYSTSCLLYYYLSLWSFAVRDEDDRKLVNNALYLLYVLILIFFAPIMLRREEPKK